MASSLESPPPSFSSLPYDVVLNVLARISRIHHPTLSLVSKSFRSILASRELDVTRTLIGKTETFLYLCLNIPKNHKYNPNPRWFTLTPTPKQKLLPIPNFPYNAYPKSPTVISIGSEIYIMGGFTNKERTQRSRKVFLLDCKSHQWRILPEMRISRGHSAAGLIDGKIYVFGGCSTRYNDENWGEIYDPKSQTWEPLWPTTLTRGLINQKTVRMDVRKFLGKWTISLTTNLCFVGEDKIFCRSRFKIGGLQWFDIEEGLGWREVKGLEGLSPHLISVANPEGGRRLTAWWRRLVEKEEEKVAKTEIWCSEISFERRSREELCGIVEWSKMLYTFHSSKSDGFVSILHSAIVTH